MGTQSPPQPPPFTPMSRQSFAIAMKDYPVIRPGIAVSISAACLVAALVIGFSLVSSLRQASRTVELGRRTVFTLHGYNAALEAWQQLATGEDPSLQRPESRALRDSIRVALTGQLQQLRASMPSEADRQLIDNVLRALQSGPIGLDAAARQAMIVLLSRQDAALFEAVGASQRAMLLAAALVTLTILAAGTLVVPMAWLYIRYKRAQHVQMAR